MRPKFRIWDRRIEEMYQDPGHFYVTADGEVFDVNTDLELEDQEYELMQYTGIKNKNGVEIYSGDIVRFQDKHNDTSEDVGWLITPIYTGEVTFKDGAFCIERSCSTHYRLMDYNMEVIGNKYQSTKEGIR